MSSHSPGDSLLISQSESVELAFQQGRCPLLAFVVAIGGMLAVSVVVVYNYVIYYYYHYDYYYYCYDDDDDDY